MISKRVSSFCCEDICLIENYEEAVNASEMYECHHRKEDEGYSRKYLIDNGLYFKQPAKDLIFLSKYAHRSLHNTKERNPMYGKELTEEQRKRISLRTSGENNPNYGNHSPKYKSRGKKRTEEQRRRISEGTKNAMKKVSKEKLGYWKGKHWRKDPETGKHIYY